MQKSLDEPHRSGRAKAFFRLQLDQNRTGDDHEQNEQNKNDARRYTVSALSAADRTNGSRSNVRIQMHLRMSPHYFHTLNSTLQRHFRAVAH